MFPVGGCRPCLWVVQSSEEGVSRAVGRKARGPIPWQTSSAQREEGDRFGSLNCRPGALGVLS